MATLTLPITAAQTLKVSSHSIDGFNATTAGLLTITGNDGVARGYPMVVGFNPISIPLSSNTIDTGLGTIVSSGAIGTVNVSGASVPVTVTVAQLPTPATSPIGLRAIVSDSTLAYTTANVGTTVVGGAANATPVFNNGTNWVIG